jgi:UDP-GlcNAc:undecaprenyl-phosphate GlcNAc-1-phosphate transferase
MNYLFPFLLTFFLSVFLTGFFRSLGQKLKIMTTPRTRDIHKKPIPRIGGLAIFISFFLVSLIWFIVGHSGIEKHVVGIWLGSAFLVLVMFYDDIRGLKAWQKLLAQIVATGFIIASGIGINTLTNPFGGAALNLNSVYIPILTYHGITYHFSLWSDLLTIVWLVGIMNIINFVDGVDGLAGGVSAIAAITIFMLSSTLLQTSTALIAIVLAGAIIGFLVWNFPPAKIFMGDTGSMFLGFVLGALTLVSGGKLATVFLVLGFPIVDGLIVVFGRIKRRENPFTTPDKTHLHHRFLKAGFSQRESIVSMYLISVAFAWVALRSNTENKIIASFVLIFAVFLLTRLLNYKIKKLS